MAEETFNPVNVLSFYWELIQGLPRKLEIEQRETAQREKGCVVVGSGQRGKPRRMAQMVSVRLEPLLLRKALDLAEHNEITLSDVLREGLRRL